MTVRRSPRQGDRWVNPYTNEETDPGLPSAKLRHYLSGDIAGMISKWGYLNDDAAIVRAAEIVADLVRRRNTTVFECFYLDDRGYLAFVFADDIEKGSCWVRVGYVDQVDHTEWCAPSPKSGIWRTYLPTSRTGDKDRGSDWRIEAVECRNCPGMVIKVTATCNCGWNAAAEPADYDD